MASKLFFDPLVALRAAPLVSSTCTLLFSWDQHLFLSTMNHPAPRRHSRALLPSYWDVFFYRGLPQVLGFLALTVGTAAANLCTRRPALERRGSFLWYAAGAAFAVGHLLFVPLVAPRIQAIVEDKPETDANAELEGWLSVNRLRMVTVDLAAWAACVVAVGKTLQA